MMKKIVKELTVIACSWWLMDDFCPCSFSCYVFKFLESHYIIIIFLIFISLFIYLAVAGLR